jgi:hypothetical protein
VSSWLQVGTGCLRLKSSSAAIPLESPLPSIATSKDAFHRDILNKFGGHRRKRLTLTLCSRYGKWTSIVACCLCPEVGLNIIVNGVRIMLQMYARVQLIARRLCRRWFLPSNYKAVLTSLLWHRSYAAFCLAVVNSISLMKNQPYSSHRVAFLAFSARL